MFHDLKEKLTVKVCVKLPVNVCVCVLVAKSCPTLCDPMDCSPPGSSVHGILQAWLLEWLPFPCPRELPDSGIEPRSPALQAILYHESHQGIP